LSELARLLDRLPAPPRAYVAFVLPDGVGSDWEDTDLWSSAAAISGVRVFADRGGREAASFSSGTSGTTLVYDVDGKLLFSGGITQARGHEGNSFGQERILALLNGKTTDRATSPVFGRALDDKGATEASP